MGCLRGWLGVGDDGLFSSLYRGARMCGDSYHRMNVERLRKCLHCSGLSEC
jgi:hypothetical protein